jgi:photosystem II stability/assembly factor-like uncharacterized protein
VLTYATGGSHLHVHDGNAFVIDSGVVKHFDVDRPEVVDIVALPPSSFLQQVSMVDGDLLVRVYQRSRQRLYRTSDVGATWRPLDSTVRLERLRVARDGELFGFGPRVSRSVDGGMSWSTLLASTDTLAYNDVQITPEGTLLLSTSRGVERSDDDGATWRRSEGGMQASTVINLTPNPGGGIFAIMYAHEIEVRLMAQSMTEDGGATWKSTQSLPAWWNFGNGAARPAGFDDAGTLYVAGMNGLYRSSDRGETWTSLGLVGGGRVLSIAMTRDTLMTVTDNDRVYRSIDRGTTWTLLATAPPLASGSGSVAYAHDGALLLGTAERHHRSTDGGLTWTPTQLTAWTGDYIRGSNGFMYMVSPFGLFRSPDGYRDWVNLWPILSTNAPSIAVSGTTHVMLHDSLYVSLDDGVTWRTWQVGMEHEMVACIAVDARGRFCAGTYGGGVYIMDVPSAVKQEDNVPDIDVLDLW